jgi:hypothetical protein
MTAAVMNDIAVGDHAVDPRSSAELVDVTSSISGSYVTGILLTWAMSAALVVPPIVADIEMHRPIYSAGPGSLALDMLTTHLPQINFFIAHPWNLIDYPGVVTSLPGHHVLLAWVARLIGYASIDSKTLPIRLFHAFICSIGAVGLLCFLHRMQCSRPRSPSLLMSLILWISVVASFYFLQSSIYVSTDVPAINFYMLFLYFLVFYPEMIALPTISAAAVVFWRQSYAPALLTPFLTERDRVLTKLLSSQTLVLIGPGAVLLLYVLHWGGLVPANSGGPTDILRGIGGLFPQSVLRAFALLGLFLPAYALIFADDMATCYRMPIAKWAMMALLLLVIVIWITCSSTYSYKAGRWASVVWTISNYAPHWRNHSISTLLLAIFGALFSFFLGWLAVNHFQIRSIVVGMFLYLGSQIIVPLSFQRYVEPIILLSLALIAAGCAKISIGRLVMFGAIFTLYGLVGLLRIYDMFPVQWVIH